MFLTQSEVTQASLVSGEGSAILLPKSSQFLSLFKMQFKYFQLKLFQLLVTLFPKNIFALELDM